MKETIKTVCCFLIFFLFFWVFTNLLINEKISGNNYIVLIALSFVISSVIYFHENIKEIDLKNLKLTLKKTQKVKYEIKKIVIDLAKLIASLSSYSSGSWVNRKKLNDAIEKFLNNLEVKSAKKKKILELPRIVEKLMKNGRESLTKKQKMKIDSMLDIKKTN